MQDIGELSVPPVAGIANAGVEQTIVEVGGATLVRVERADVVVVAQPFGDIERDQRRRGVGRLRGADCTGA